MTEQRHFHFSLSCIGEGNDNPLQCSCLENTRDGGAWWAAVMGSHRVGHDWSDLAAEWLTLSWERHGRKWEETAAGLKQPLLTSWGLRGKEKEKEKEKEMQCPRRVCSDPKLPDHLGRMAYLWDHLWGTLFLMKQNGPSLAPMRPRDEVNSPSFPPIPNKT